MTTADPRCVLLINPPAFNALDAGGGKHNLRAAEIMACPPMSLLYLATYLKERQPDLRVVVKDYLGEAYSDAGLTRLLREEEPFLVGITCFSTNLFEAFAIARTVKRQDPSVTVIAGGPHTLIFPRETVEQPGIDLVCQGEGEKSLDEVVARLRSQRELPGIANIWIKKNGVVEPPAAFQNAFEDLDEMPDTDQGFVGAGRYYHPFLYNGGGLIVASTIRGCPFRCTYCNSAGRKPRLRGIPRVVDDVQRKVAALGVRNLFIIDDTFNISAARVREFASELMRRDLNISWAFRGRANGLDEETVRLAKRAGLAHISIGVEDFNDEGLRLIRKGETIADIRRAFAWCNRYGVKTTADFIIGLPHNQQWDKQMKLKDFIKELSPSTIQTFVLFLIPGSELYDEAVKRGIISGQEWPAHARNPSRRFLMPGWRGEMSLEDQFRINSLINKWFYLRPGYIARQLWQTRSIPELARKAQVAYAVLKTAFTQKG